MKSIKPFNPHIDASMFKFDFLNDLFDAKHYGIEYKENADGSMRVEVEVPGIKEQDLSIELSDNIISIKGERKTANSSFTVNKSFTVIDRYNTDDIAAELKNGILTLILMPKSSKNKDVRKIEIKSSK